MGKLERWIRMRCTLEDIAKRCNTSTATVSRVLSQSSYPVREELKNQIISAALYMGYKPSLLSKISSYSSIRSVAVIVPNLVNPFYSELIEGIEKACRKFHFRPILLSSDNSIEIEKRLLLENLQAPVVGIIISSISPADELSAILDSARELPIIFFDQTDRTNRKYRSINYNFKQAGFLLGKHLYETGHQSPVFMTPCFDRASRKLLRAGIQNAWKQLANSDNFQVLSLDNELLLHHPKRCTLDYQNMQFIAKNLVDQFIRLTPNADSIVAVNDLLAIAILNELKNRNISVPDDVSLLGNDGLWLSAMVSPAITSVRQNGLEIAQAAVELLNQSILETAPYESIWIEPELVIRESVKKRNEI